MSSKRADKSDRRGGSWAIRKYLQYGTQQQKELGKKEEPKKTTSVATGENRGNGGWFGSEIVTTAMG